MLMIILKYNDHKQKVCKILILNRNAPEKNELDRYHGPWFYKPILTMQYKPLFITMMIYL